MTRTKYSEICVKFYEILENVKFFSKPGAYFEEKLEEHLEKWEKCLKIFVK